MSRYSWTESEESVMAANAAFIRGELKLTPYHGGPLQHEVSSSLELLNRVHRIITINGQAGRDIEFDNGIVEQQRPYLGFLIERHRLQPLVEWFTLRDYVVDVALSEDTA